MLSLHTKIARASKVVVATIASVLLAVVMTVGPLAQSASAVTCRQYHQAPPYFTRSYDGSITWFYNGIKIVPGSGVSGCAHINVTNINGGLGSGGHCAYFRVAFYSTSDSFLYYTNPVYICATTQVVAVATNVINGTHYIMQGGLDGYFEATTLNYDVRD